MQVRGWQRTVAGDHLVRHIHLGDQRDELRPTFDDKLTAERFDAREIARDPQHVTKTLLADEHEPLARIGLALPWVSRELARRQLARDLADLIVGPALTVIAEMEIGERAVPTR